jgi:hypothetical protein
MLKYMLGCSTGASDAHPASINSPIIAIGAARLKFLHRKRRIPSSNFKWKSGTEIIDLPAALTFRSSWKVPAEL